MKRSVGSGTLSAWMGGGKSCLSNLSNYLSLLFLLLFSLLGSQGALGATIETTFDKNKTNGASSFKGTNTYISVNPLQNTDYYEFNSTGTVTFSLKSSVVASHYIKSVTLTFESAGNVSQITTTDASTGEIENFVWTHKADKKPSSVSFTVTPTSGKTAKLTKAVFILDDLYPEKIYLWGNISNWQHTGSPEYAATGVNGVYTWYSCSQNQGDVLLFFTNAGWPTGAYGPTSGTDSDRNVGNGGTFSVQFKSDSGSFNDDNRFRFNEGGTYDIELNLTNNTVTFTSVNSATGISLNKSQTTINKNESETLVATVSGSSTHSVTWTSSNTGIATVDNGTVRAVGIGSATITASIDGHSASCVVNVPSTTSPKTDMVAVPATGAMLIVDTQTSAPTGNNWNLLNSHVGSNCIYYNGDGSFSTTSKTTIKYPSGDSSTSTSKALRTKGYDQQVFGFKLETEMKVTVYAANTGSTERFFAFNEGELWKDESTIISRHVEDGRYETVVLPAGTYYMASFSQAQFDSESMTGSDLLVYAINIEPNIDLKDDLSLGKLSTSVISNFGSYTDWSPNASWGNDVKQNATSNTQKVGIIADKNHYITLTSGTGYTFHTSDDRHPYLVIEPDGPGWVEAEVGGNTTISFTNGSGVNDGLAWADDAKNVNYSHEEGYSSNPGRIYVSASNGGVITTLRWTPYVVPTVNPPSFKDKGNGNIEISVNKWSDLQGGKEYYTKSEIVYVLNYTGSDPQGQTTTTHNNDGGSNSNKFEVTATTVWAKHVITYKDPDGNTNTVESAWVKFSVGEPTIESYNEIVTEEGEKYLKVTTTNTNSVSLQKVGGGTVSPTSFASNVAKFKVSDIGSGKFTLTAVGTNGTVNTPHLVIVNEEAVLSNPDFEYDGAGGWSVAAGTSMSSWKVGNYSGNNVAERFQGTFDISQTLTGLTPGWYEVKANALYRTGKTNIAYSDYKAGKDNVLTYLYAGDYSAPVKNLYSQSFDTNLAGTSDSPASDGKYYPNYTNSAAAALSQNAYEVKLLAKVGADGQLKIGIRGNGEGANDERWSSWDNFEVTYKGTSVSDAKGYLVPLTEATVWGAETENGFGYTLSENYGSEKRVVFSGSPARHEMNHDNKLIVVHRGKTSDNTHVYKDHLKFPGGGKTGGAMFKVASAGLIKFITSTDVGEISINDGDAISKSSKPNLKFISSSGNDTDGYEYTYYYTSGEEATIQLLVHSNGYDLKRIEYIPGLAMLPGHKIWENGDFGTVSETGNKLTSQLSTIHGKYLERNSGSTSHYLTIASDGALKGKNPNCGNPSKNERENTGVRFIIPGPGVIKVKGTKQGDRNGFGIKLKEGIWTGVEMLSAPIVKQVMDDTSGYEPYSVSYEYTGENPATVYLFMQFKVSNGVWRNTEPEFNYIEYIPVDPLVPTESHVWTGNFFDNDTYEEWKNTNKTNADDKNTIRIMADETHKVTVSSSGYQFSAKGDDEGSGYLTFYAPTKGLVKIYTDSYAAGKEISVSTGTGTTFDPNFLVLKDVDDDGLARTVKLFTDDSSRRVFVSAQPGVTITKILWEPGDVNGETADLRPVTAETVWAKDNKFGGYDYPSNVNTFVLAPRFGEDEDGNTIITNGGGNRLNNGRGQVTSNGRTYPPVPNNTLLIYGGDAANTAGHPVYFTTTGNLMLNNTSNNTERMVEFKVKGSGVVQVVAAGNGPTGRDVDIAAYNHEPGEVISKAILEENAITGDKHAADKVVGGGTGVSPVVRRDASEVDYTANDEEHMMTLVRHQHSSYHSVYAYYEGPEDFEQSIFVYAHSGGISIQEIHWYPGKVISDVVGKHLSEEGCLKITAADGTENIPETIFLSPNIERQTWETGSDILHEDSYSFYAKVTTEKEVASWVKEPVWTTSQAGRKGFYDKWILTNTNVGKDSDTHTALNADTYTTGVGYVALTGTEHPFTLNKATTHVYDEMSAADIAAKKAPSGGEDRPAFGIMYVVAGTWEGNRNDMRRVEVLGLPTRLDLDIPTRKIYMTVGDTRTIGATPVTEFNDLEVGGVYGSVIDMTYVEDPSAVTWRFLDDTGVASIPEDNLTNYPITGNKTESTIVTAVAPGTTTLRIAVPGVFKYDYSGKSAWVATTLYQDVVIVVEEKAITLTRVLLDGERMKTSTSKTTVSGNTVTTESSKMSNEIENVDVISPQVYLISGITEHLKSITARLTNNLGNTPLDITVNASDIKTVNGNKYVILDVTKYLQHELLPTETYEHTNYDAVHEMSFTAEMTADGENTPVYVVVDDVKETVVETTVTVENADGTTDTKVEKKTSYQAEPSRIDVTTYKTGDTAPSSSKKVLTFETINDNSGTEIETFIYNASQRGAVVDKNGGYSNALAADVDKGKMLCENILDVPYTAAKFDPVDGKALEGTPTQSWYGNHRSYIRLSGFSTDGTSGGDMHLYNSSSTKAKIEIKPYNTTFGNSAQEEAIDKVEVYFDINSLPKTGDVTFTVGGVPTTISVDRIKANNGIATWQYSRKEDTSGDAIVKWDFTNWSKASVKQICGAKGWVKNEKAPAEGEEPYIYIDGNEIRWNKYPLTGNATASGIIIPELKGLNVNIEAYGIGTAFDYQNTKDRSKMEPSETEWGPYEYPSYLWLTRSSSKITVPNVKVGSTLKLGVETHKKVKSGEGSVDLKNSEARGFKVKVNGSEIGETTQTTVGYQVFEYTIPSTAGSYVNVELTPTKGCHLYSIEAEVGATPWVHDMDIEVDKDMKIDQIKIDYYSASPSTKTAYKTFHGYTVNTDDDFIKEQKLEKFESKLASGIEFQGIPDGTPGIKMIFRQNKDLRHFSLREEYERESTGVNRGSATNRIAEKTSMVIRDDKSDPCEMYIFNKGNVANIKSVEFIYEPDDDGKNNLSVRDIFCTSDPRNNPNNDLQTNICGWPLEDMPLSAGDYYENSSNKTHEYEGDQEHLRKLVYTPESPVNFASFTLNSNQTGFIFVRKIIVRYDDYATKSAYSLSNISTSSIDVTDRKTSSLKVAVPKGEVNTVSGYLLKRTSTQNNISNEVVLQYGEYNSLNQDSYATTLKSHLAGQKMRHNKFYTVRVLDEHRMIKRQMSFRTEDTKMPTIKCGDNVNTELRSEDPLTELPSAITIQTDADDADHPQNKVVIVYTTDGSAPSVTFGGNDGRQIVDIQGQICAGTGVSFTPGSDTDEWEEGTTSLKALFKKYNNGIVIKALAMPLTEVPTSYTKDYLKDKSCTYGETSEITRANYTFIEDPGNTFFTTATRKPGGGFHTKLDNSPYDIISGFADNDDKFHGAYQPKASDNNGYTRMAEIFTYGGYELYKKDYELYDDDWFAAHPGVTDDGTKSHKFRHDLLANEYWQVKANDATPWRGLREMVAGDTYVMCPLEPFSEKALPLYKKNEEEKVIKATDNDDFATVYETETGTETSTANDAIRYFKGQFDNKVFMDEQHSYYRTWRLPCYGDFLRFEPEKNGTLTVYVKQQGVLEQEDGRVDDQLLRFRPVYIYDEAGNTPAGITASTTSKVSGDWMTMKHTLNKPSKYLNADATAAFKKICDQWIINNTAKRDGDNRIVYSDTETDESGNPIPDIEYGDRAYESQGVIVLYGDLDKAKAQTKRIKEGETEPSELDYTGIDRTTSEFTDILNTCLGPRGTGEPNGFMIISEGYVKYELPVRAGKTYFMFAANGNLGFCSYKFSEDDNVYNADGTVKGSLTADGGFTIRDAKDEDVQALFDACLDKTNNICKTATSVALTRTFTNNRWASLVLPFSVSMHQLRKLFGDGVRVSHFNDITEVNNARYPNPNNTSEYLTGTIHRIATRHHVHQMIVAGVPVFIRPSFPDKGNDYAFTVTFRNVTVEKDAVEEVETNIYEPVDYVGSYGGSLSDKPLSYKCIGSFKNGKVYDGDIYMKASEGAFVQRVNGTANIQGMRGWIVPISTPKKLNLMNFSMTSSDLGQPEEAESEGDVATEIDIINVDGDDSLGKIYNLKGQLVGNNADELEHLPQGVYIIDGIKHVVK